MFRGFFVSYFFFFFQAEDGIRDRNVTGVQTCALPIWGDVLHPRRQRLRDPRRRPLRLVERRFRRRAQRLCAPSLQREPDGARTRAGDQDRKSTRLNSSHVSISYAVFCLKKKKQNKTQK